MPRKTVRAAASRRKKGCWKGALRAGARIYRMPRKTARAAASRGKKGCRKGALRAEIRGSRRGRRTRAGLVGGSRLIQRP